MRTRSTCPYCGVGCGVIIESRDGEVTGVTGDPDHPANFGRLCTKGSTLHLTAAPLVQRHARAAVPELRRVRDEPRRPVDWDTALDHVADRFAACIREHGPDSVAFYVSGQLLTEDYYVFNKLAKGLIGTNNIDTNSRLCMSSAVSGYKQTLGADAPPLSYADVEAADCLFITGSNTAWAHPVLYRRIEAARAARPAMRLIVVDPRRTDTTALADLHLPILPGTDVALHHAMLNRMLWEGWIARDYIAAHTEGFDALREQVREATPRWAAEVCGVPVESIERAAEWFARSPATVSLYCQGLNQSASGTANNASLINLHLATGQIGRPGAGPLSLTGQPNAMGGREVGGMANLLSAHRDLADPRHRDEVARLWGIGSVPAKPGRTAVEMFDALASGEIRMIWIACTNPLHSMPDAHRVREALLRAELVVVQDAYRTPATVAQADVLLPATTWGEKDGTVTNSERRISRVRAAVPPFGQARHDWAIAVDFARRLAARLPDAPRHLFPYDGPESIWNEHRETTRGRDLDIGGLSYALLDARGPQQWPYPRRAAQGAARLYTDGRFATPSGRARFATFAPSAVAEPTDARYPLHLNTGRLRDQWHGMSRSGLLGRLFAHAPEPAIELAAAELDRRGLQDGELVRVSSRRGSQVLPVRASPTLRAGSAFIAMHWGPEWLTGQAGGRPTLGVNGLTSPAVDPFSRQPELKHCAVRIDRVALPNRLLAFGWLPDDRLSEARRALPALFEGCAFVSGVPFGRDRQGMLLRVADANPFRPSTLDEVQRHFAIDPLAMLRYDDARAGTSRRLVVGDQRLQFVMLVGDQASEAWLREYLECGTPVAAIGRMLLSPSAAAPVAAAARGRTVCTCVGVGEQAIVQVLRQCAGSAAARLEAVQRKLACGTQCGSCLPELRQLAARMADEAPVVG